MNILHEKNVHKSFFIYFCKNQLSINQTLEHMKKLSLSLMMLFLFVFAYSQTVPREMVAMEIGTGTWCTYCPGAAMGADDLLENGCKVAVMENHNGDSYANNYSNARNTYYAISGYPTAIFDGLQRVVGGSHSSSMYTSYLPKYNARINVPANMFLESTITNNGLDYTAVITITKVGTVTATDLKLHFFVTQSGITQNWQGQTHLEHVTRLMVPDQNGTSVSFTSGNVQTVTLNFTLNAAWPLEDVEFITFVQSVSTKECFNTLKRAAVDLTPGFTASSTSIVKNETVTFTNTTFGGYIGVPETTYEWIFPGTVEMVSTDANPVVTYNEVGVYDVTLIASRGGQVDTLVMPGYITVNAPVGVAEKTKELSASIYPNPNNGAFTLEVNTLKNQNVNMKVVNASNVSVYEESNVQINGQLVKKLNLNLSSGVYFVVLESNGNKVSQKFLVK